MDLLPVLPPAAGDKEMQLRITFELRLFGAQEV